MTETPSVIDVDVIDDEHYTSAELAIRESSPATIVTVGDVQSMLIAARDLMQNVMKEGIDNDYAKVPGCGPKPILLQPGADKLRMLFNLGVTCERTLLEVLDAGGFVCVYKATVTTADGRVIGDLEAAASHEEATFKNRDGSLAPLNTLIKRAQKRARVGAIAGISGVRDLFSTATEAPQFLAPDQRAIIAAVYELVIPKQAEMVAKQATKVKSAQWETYLGAALDAAQAVKSWSDEQRETVFTQLAYPIGVDADEIPVMVERVVTGVSA